MGAKLAGSKVLRQIALCSILVFGTIACGDFFNPKADTSPAGERVGSGRGQLNGSGASDPFPEGFDPLKGEFTDAKLLASVGLNTVAPLATDFRFQMESLEREIAASCRELATVGTDSDASRSGLVRAQKSWSEAMLSYHRLMVVGLDPVQTRSRDVYSWPELGLCPIDQAVASASAGAADLKNSVYTQRGLGAIEYLLFDSAEASACPLNNPRFQAVRDWLQKPLSERLQARCLHAERLAKLVTEKAREIEDEWSPAKGNFSKRWSEGRAHGTVQSAMNALSNNLFVLERLKYDRLGRPLGVRDCDEQGPCPNLVEHSFSGLSLSAARAQVEIALEVFEGGSRVDSPRLGSTEAKPQQRSRGWGLSDALTATRTAAANVSGASVAQEMTLALKAAQATLTKAEAQGSFKQQIQGMGGQRCGYRVTPEELANQPEVCGVFQSVRKVVDLLKRDFLLALSLRAPPTFQGDAD